MSTDPPRRLGRGLEALLSAQKPRAAASDVPGDSHHPATSLQMIRIADIAANHFQPRRIFSEPELAELEASIKASGLLQPITVRARTSGGWELVAGERRLRAAGRLGWTEIPAIVREFDDRAMITLALVENLQRADLNAVEEAEGYQRLIGEFGLTQQQVADAVGKDRTTITNLLRLLALGAPIRRMVEQGHLSAGHARALLVIKDEKRQHELANEAVARQLSVRQLEARTRLAAGNSAAKGSPAKRIDAASPTQANDPAVRRIEELLRKRLQTDVAVQPLGNERGVLRISFFNHDDLERILDMVLGANRSDFD